MTGFGGFCGTPCVDQTARAWMAALAAGAAIKAVDAAVDDEAGVLPAAAGSWALLLMAAAASLSPEFSASLAICAWALGMLFQAGPGPGRAWARRAEAVLVAVAGAAWLGARPVAASAAALAAVQAIDHLLDMGWPPGQPGQGPLRSGLPVSGLLAAAGALGLAGWLDAGRLAMVLSATPAAEDLGNWLCRRPGLLERPPGAGRLRWAP